VSDVASGLSTQELADLCALADGTLPADRRPEVEARVAGSPELQELLEQQRRAVQATRLLAADDVPASLQAAVEEQRRALGSSRSRGRRLVPRLALAGAVAIAAAVVAAVVLSGGPGAPTVADAARLATQPPTGPAPAPAGTAGTRLAVALEGISFPDFARLYGWTALGVRHGRVDGRDATVVVYGKGQRRLGYAIVAGAGLSRPADGETAVIDGVEYQTLRLNDLLAVTWRRGGHTCVLIGQAPRAELLKLASWPLNSPR
jgi:anti-sigma factor RsiW